MIQHLQVFVTKGLKKQYYRLPFKDITLLAAQKKDMVSFLVATTTNSSNKATSLIQKYLKAQFNSGTRSSMDPTVTHLAKNSPHNLTLSIS